MKKYLFLALIIAAVFTACKDTDNTGDPSVETYTVTFDDNGGSGGPESVTATFGQAMPAITAAPTQTGKDFNGYFDAATGGTKYYNADLTSAHNWDKHEGAKLYAQWVGSGETTSKITFNQNGGTGGQTTEVTATHGQAMPAITAAPTQTGKDFNGYFDAQTGGNKYYNADLSSAKNWDKSADTELFAQWTANPGPGGSYSVSFDANTGEGGQTTAVTVTNGEAMPTLTAQPPTKIENIPTTSITYRGTTFTTAGNAYTNGQTYNLDKAYDGFNKEYFFDGYFDATTGGTKYYNADLSSAQNWDKTEGGTLYARWLSPEEKYPESFGSNPLDPFDYTAHFTDTPPVIDGKGDDAVWEKAQWKPVDQQWMSLTWSGGANSLPNHPATGCFRSGRYKALWTTEKVYLLVEIVDDVLSKRPNWTWNQNPENSDCVELFIDEDASGGQRSGTGNTNNFFTYHMNNTTATGVKQVNDYNHSGGANTNIGADLDYMVSWDGQTEIADENAYIAAATTGTVTQIWEIGITLRNSSNVAVTNLTEGKKIGLIVAYCDANTKPSTNAQTRQNMFCSMFVKGTSNSMRDLGYQQAHIYPKMYLVK